MFYSWSNKNKITTKSLQIQYTGAFVGWRMYNDTPWYRVYEFHRLATKEYQYVGMTEAAAKACQDAKLAQYTRKFTQWYTSEGVYAARTQFLCVANVTMDSDEDGLWTVNISVSEDQVQFCGRIHGVTDIPYTLFDQSLDYDEEQLEGGFLRISSIYRDYGILSLNYQQNIAGFDHTSSDFHVENLPEGTTTWLPITPSSITADKIRLGGIGSWQQGLIRLRWGDYIVSNTEVTPETEYANTLHLYTPYYQVVGDEGAWRIQFEEDFPNFDSNLMKILRLNSDGSTWDDISEQCIVTDGDRIVTPITDRGTLFFIKTAYGAVESNVQSNAANFFTVDGEPDVVISDGDTVVTATIHFTTTLETLDINKVTIHYKDANIDQIVQNPTVSQDSVSWYASADQIESTIPEGGMQVVATLFYDGIEIGTARKTVYRE